ncbi:unnamed protein product [Rotaria sp. Silwood2]|nr:unnamed protein product [Rotaria sp. Silwood2]CAF2941459.1 unnamed protein product [Rotaria sp. Silwood2]CAF3135033.1 unnamed protein product [Rotaria sp. Silwood2]CAF4219797.1 unnamed protein product [Rotaria sp. Silwood2]CAF4386365.1 unnamed protein product [Rotaria sp. Silwood2]
MVSLAYIAQQYTLYVGSILFVMGVFGNFMVILIFSMDRQYRITPCTFYFLVASVHDMLLIVIVLGLRLLTVGFGIDLTRMSVVWCKARYYFFSTWAGILLTCQCLATLDQFLITSRNARLRRLSSIKGAYRAVVVTLIVWWLHGIPWLIYQDISPISGACVYVNPIFLRYVIFFGLISLFMLPTAFLTVFGFLAYRNISQTAALSEQNAHRQMTIMVCVKIFPVVLSGIFNGGWNIYTLATYEMVKSPDLLSKEHLFQSMIALLAYLGSSVSV